MHMTVDIDNLPETSTQNKSHKKNYQKRSLKEPSSPPSPTPQPTFLKKPVRAVIDKSVLAAFLNQTSDGEKKELIQDKSEGSVKLWTRCGYCQVYLKVSNLEKHLGKCCAKLGMVIKK